MTARMDVAELLNVVDAFHESGLEAAEVQVGSLRLSLRAEGQATGGHTPDPRPSGVGTPDTGTLGAREPDRGHQAITVTAPVLGIIASVDNGGGVAQGSRVSAGQVVAVLEVRRRRVDIAAPVAGTIARVLLHPGALAEYGAPLLEIDPDGAGGSGDSR